MSDRSAWSAAGGVVALVSGTNAIALAIAGDAAHSRIPLAFPYVFGAIALASMYLLLAPLLSWWPFRGPASVAHLLDILIRQGHEARERLLQARVQPLDAATVAAEWTLRSANRLHDNYPAIMDRFLLAAGTEESFSGQALLIQTINAKLDVLINARTQSGI
jgi:hypothetical protein